MIHLYDAKSFANLRKSQFDAFHTAKPGSWFDRATDILSSHDADLPVLAIGVESGEAVVYNSSGIALRKLSEKKITDDQGNVTVVEVEGGVLKQGHRGWLIDLTDGQVGCSPVVAEVNGHRYSAGMMIVTGRGDTGKTPLVHALGELLGGDDKYATVRFGEPLSGYNTDFNSLIDDIANAMLKYRVIVIDSLKNVIGAAGGNTTSGGISRGAFDLLSDVGAMAASRGCVVIASLNPTSNDAKIVELVNEAAKSNSTSLAIATERDGEWQFITRTGEGLQRLKHTLYTSYGEHSVLTISDSSESNNSVKKSRIGQVVIKNDELEATLRRLTTPTQN